MIRRVLFCGAWDEGDGYPRTAALRQGLQRAGVEVSECRAGSPPRGKAALLVRPWRWPGACLSLLWRRLWLRASLRAALRRHRPDAVVVPYPGHDLVAGVARAARELRVPVVLDLFLSAFDTAVVDRELFAPSSLPARWLRALDRSACRAADLVLLDTPQNAAFVADLTALPPEHFAWVPVGDPQAPQDPAPYVTPRRGSLGLLFFGTGVPLHGLDTLLAAVAVTPAVTLTLVGGTDDDRRRAQALLGHRLALEPPFVDRVRLQQLLDRAGLVAGVFGRSDKTQRVVPFKVVHALASGRPVITADTPAVRAVLEDGDGAFLVPAGDTVALAARLQALADDPAVLAAAAARARAVHDRHFATEQLGSRLVELFDGLVAAGANAT